MDRVTEALRAAGLRSPAEVQPPDLRVECTRLARLLRERALHTLGMYPAGDDVAVAPAALELGRSLAEQGSVVGVVDAAAGWPCAATLERDARADGRAAVTSWARERLAVLTPRVARRGGLEQLREVLGQESRAFDHLLVDLTGYERRGEHLAASELLHGWVLVVRSGRTKARLARRWLRHLPEASRLGLLLVGTT